MNGTLVTLTLQGGGIATWENTIATGNLRRKNHAIGPVAAHVFEGEGSHTVNVTCESSNGTIESASQTIWVDSPNDPQGPWGGQNTICVSNSNNFDQCPSGARQVVSNNALSILNQYAGPGKRILLRRGDQFSHNGQFRKHDAQGPTLVGAFGSGPKPRISGASGANSQGIIAFEGMSDWRFSDLDFNATGGSNLFCAQGVCNGGVQDPNDHILFLRIDSNGFRASLLGTHNGMSNRNERHRHMFWVGPSRLVGDGQNILFTDGWGGGIIDTHLENGFHNFRVMCIRDYVIQHNRAIDGVDVTHRGCTDLPGAQSYRIVVSDNEFALASRIPGPQSGLHMEVHYMVFERNFLNQGTNQLDPYYSVFRNNVCVRSGNNACFEVRHNSGGNPTPRYSKFYNNSFFNPTSNHVGVRFINTMGPGLECKNNLIYSPGGGSADACRDNAGGDPISIQNNVNDSQTSPYVVSSPSAPAHFKLNAGAGEALDRGMYIDGLVRDFFNQARTGLPDIGAMESNSTSTTQLSKPAKPILLNN